MKRIVACLALTFCYSAIAFAQSANAASKAAATSSTAVLFRMPTGGNVPDAGAWVTVLETNIKPPGGKDLFISFTAQSEIVTVNNNISIPGVIVNSDTAGTLFVRVLVDNALASPGFAVLNASQTTVVTRLSTQLSNCTEVDVSPNAGTVTCASSPSTLEAILLHVSSNGFNFIMQDVSPGDSHNIKVQIQFFASGPATGLPVEAILGIRTLTVEQVKLDAQ